jgi:hypothetical protein
MRSEKEIRKKDFNDFCVDVMETDQEKIKAWLFDDVSRYSAKELKKIYLSKKYPADEDTTTYDFILFLEDNPVKVKEILEND